MVAVISQADPGQLFATMDDLFSSRAAPADVLAALRSYKRSCTDLEHPGKRSRMTTGPLPQQGSADPPPTQPVSTAELCAVPARPSGKAASLPGRGGASVARGFGQCPDVATVPGLRLSAKHVPVVVLQDASGGIGKWARGAAAFLLEIKLLQTWLLVLCPSEVCYAATPTTHGHRHLSR
jgi:hypothetical protein